jgi:GntR family transcriptional regulator, transcriptional repressor for pyruvate dehydrogenase complex
VNSLSDTPTATRPLKVAAIVAAELRRRIATGELKPGDRLPPEGGLMEEFDLARTTLREALRILESEGLITVQRGRNGGPRITEPPVDRLARAFAVHLQLQRATMGDLDRARQFIEPALAAAMATSHTEDDLEALEDAIALASTAAKAGDRRAFGDAAAAVHATVVERGGNTTLALMAQMLREVVVGYYRFAATTASTELMERAVRSYRRLRRYIEDGDAEGAAQHWRKQMAYTIGHIDEQQPFELYPTAASNNGDR